MGSHHASSGRVADKSVSCPEEWAGEGGTASSGRALRELHRRLLASRRLASAGTFSRPVERIFLGPYNRGNPVPKPNYRQAKKQKELSRKARQLEKQQRRAARANDSGEVATPSQAPAVGPSDETLSSGT